MLITTGLALLSTIDHTTPILEICGFLVVLGLGVGMSMQNLVLAVQNTVDLRNIGAASSLVSFLRSLGGTIGVTVLGVVLSGRVSELLGGSAAAAAGLSDLATLSPLQAEALRAAYGDGIGLVFGIAAVASLITLVAVATDQGGPAPHHRRPPARAPPPAPPAPAA